MTEIKLEAKCVGCGNKKILSEKDVKEAQEMGCPICDKCFMPMTVERASLK